jgi:aryl-phospho-beta-D-glucosidase BglC (GH1 family)
LYEICNEPNGNVDWDDVKEYANIIIPLIRENDPNTIIICGSPTWSQDVDIAVQSPLKYDNLMYTLHFYSGTHGSYLRSKAEVALKKGLAIFVTEFGTSRADGNGGVYTKECDVWFDWMEKNCISWANWSFCDKNETSAALKPGSADQQNWNNVSESGEYIKNKLLEENKFVACTDTTPYYKPDEIPNFDDGDGVEDYDNDIDLTLYPNPSNGTFSIKTDLAIMRVVVYDVLGNQVADFDGENEEFAVQLQKGIYYVKIYGSDFTTMKEILIE